MEKPKSVKILTLGQLDPSKTYSLQKLLNNPQLFDNFFLSEQGLKVMILNHKEELGMFAVTRSPKIKNFFIKGDLLITFIKNKGWREKI